MAKDKDRTVSTARILRKSAEEQRWMEENAHRMEPSGERYLAPASAEENFYGKHFAEGRRKGPKEQNP